MRESGECEAAGGKDTATRGRKQCPLCPWLREWRHSSVGTGCLLFPGAAPPAPFLFLLLSWKVAFSASILSLHSRAYWLRSLVVAPGEAQVIVTLQLFERQCYQADNLPCFLIWVSGLEAYGAAVSLSSPAKLVTHGALWTLTQGFDLLVSLGRVVWPVR